MNKAGIELLKEYEGWASKAYIPVPGDVPTIGYGFTQGVKMGDTMTRPQGEARLKKEVAKYEQGVEKACKVSPNENQLAAMTCLAFNIGPTGFAKSTVLKAHNRGDEQSASRAFGMWNKSSGVVYAGLTRRRAAEAALYLKPIPEEQADHPMPQSIEEEKPLSKSPLNLIGAGSAGTGALGFLSEVTNEDSGVGSALSTAREWGGEIAGSFGLSPLAVFCLVIVLVGAGVMYFRWRQKSNGWT